MSMTHELPKKILAQLALGQAILRTAGNPEAMARRYVIRLKDHPRIVLGVRLTSEFRPLPNPGWQVRQNAQVSFATTGQICENAGIVQGASKMLFACYDFPGNFMHISLRVVGVSSQIISHMALAAGNYSTAALYSLTGQAVHNLHVTFGLPR